MAKLNVPKYLGINSVLKILKNLRNRRRNIFGISGKRSHEAYHGESYQGGKAFDRPKKSRSMLSSHMEPYHGIEEKQSEYRNTYKPDIKGEEGRPKPSWYTWNDERQPF